MKPDKETERIVFNEMRPVTVGRKGKDWTMGGIHFESMLKNRANDHDAFGYSENGNKMVFACDKMGWGVGTPIKVGANPSKGVIDTEASPPTLTYPDALGDGINIKIIQDNYRWQKIIEIESLDVLGDIPPDAKYLEISFKVSGDFDLPDGEITGRIKFGEDSFLQPIRAWDSSAPDEEVETGVVGIVDNKVITKKIPVGWLKSATYPVCADTTITYGSENVFSSYTTKYLDVASLDSTHFVVAYRDENNANYGTSRIGSVSGTTISYGPAYVFHSAHASYISVSIFDSTHFVVAYCDSGNSARGTAIIGSVSGTTISYGSAQVFNSAASYYESVSVMDSTHFMVAYRATDNSDYGTAIIGSVSGTTISYGSEYVFNSALTSHISVSSLDSTSFVVAYQDNGNSSHGTATIGSVSGTTISYGSEYVFNSAVTPYVSVASLDSTHFVVAYRDDGNSYYGTAITGSVSGTAITFGSEYVFNSASTPYISVASLDSTSFVVAYRDVGNSDYGTAIICSVSGTTISYGTAYVFNSGATNYISVSSLDSTIFVTAYQDAGNLVYGTAIVGEITADEFVPQIIIT